MNEKEELNNWILIKPQTEKMFAVISKSNSENELISSVKSVKGTMFRMVKMYVREAKVNTLIVTSWDIYHKFSDGFKSKNEILIYSDKADWCEDVWQCGDPKMFVDWHMSSYDRILIVGGSKFIKKFKEEVGSIDPIKFNHIITVVGTNTKKGWPILKTGDYKKDTNFFKGECKDNVNVFVF
jgi:hypothetical protein